VLIPRVSFSSPQKNKIVILDEGGSDIIGRMVLKDIDYEVLPSRGEVVFVSLSLLVRMIRNLPLIDWGETVRRGKWFRSLYLLNMISCLQAMEPSVVVTFVDNSQVFHWLSLHHEGAEFIAIQNGMRNRYNVSDEQLPKRPEFGSVISIPHYYCFGQNEIDLFNKYGHDIKNYYPMGSLRGGYYWGELYAEKFNDLFDICFVSEWLPPGLQYVYFDKMRETLRTISEYLKMYQDRRKDLKLCIAMRSNESGEREYYQDIFGRDVYLISFDMANMSTYRAMNSSKVVVNFYCTAALEALGWGKKVLFCNYMEDSYFDIPGDGICLLKERSYDSFEKRLNELLQIDQESYERLIDQWKTYYMNFQQQCLPHHTIRKAILDRISM